MLSEQKKCNLEEDGFYIPCFILYFYFLFSPFFIKLLFTVIICCSLFVFQIFSLSLTDYYCIYFRSMLFNFVIIGIGITGIGMESLLKMLILLLILSVNIILSVIIFLLSFAFVYCYNYLYIVMFILKSLLLFFGLVYYYYPYYRYLHYVC